MSQSLTALPVESPSWKPHSYQLASIRLMITQACAGLFLDPGLGKTSISFGAFKILREKKFVHGMLVIAPLRVCYNVWPKEAKKWLDFHDLKVHILHKAGMLEIPRADIYVINPEGLEWFHEHKLARRLGLDMLVVDESTKFKNSSTQRFKTIKKLLPSFKRRYILTGTPAPNGLLDLFGQIYILDEGNALGRFITHYRNAYFYSGGYGGYDWYPQPDAMARISERIAPLVLRLSAKDYLELPELVINEKRVQLPPEARKVYNEMESFLIAQIAAGEITAANAAVASGKCRQISNGALYVYNDEKEKREYEILHTEKLDALSDLLDELSGQPALILYEFNFERDMIKKELKIPYFGFSEKTDSEINDLFNAGKLRAAMGQAGSVSHGLNLQGSAAHVIWYGMTWNLEHYDQGIRRILRQGNPNKSVFVYHIVAEDTIDELMMSVVKLKDRTQSTLLSSLKSLRKV